VDKNDATLLCQTEEAIAIGLSSLNRCIDVVWVHNSQAQGWSRRGPVSLRETCAGALSLNLALLGPESANAVAHDGPAIAGLSK